MVTQTAATTTHPIERILPLFKSYKELPGEGRYHVPCPSHNDTEKSAAIWKDGPNHVGMQCFAGCSHKAMLDALGIEWQDLYRERRKVEPQAGISLMDLSADKLIYWHFLENLGITDGHTDSGRRSVHIPYHTSDGGTYERYRIRTAITATGGSSWNTGTDAPIIPYGLERLGDAREAGYQVIVEGESDCWTLWQRGFPALGIPGAKNTKTLAFSHVEGIGRVYIMREPPNAKDKQAGKDPGKTFVEDCKKRLLTLGYQGKIYELNLKQSHDAKDPNELHKRDTKAFKASFQDALSQAQPLFKERKKPTISRLSDLRKEVLPEMKWAIDPILPEGVTILGGKPKLGKSWLALAILNAIATGGQALGVYPVEQGEVLYIALEDGKRRLQDRANTLLGQASASDDFYYATDWARIDQGGLEDLEEWITDHPRARLICIDTWARFKPKAQGGHHGQQYDEDYDALAPLQKLASKHSVSILVVDHMRKMEADDWLDMISGSVGKTGAVDGFLCLFRKRQEDDARLGVAGRDIKEEQELLLTFNRQCASWIVKGNADDTTLAATPERQAILDVLKTCERGLTCEELSKRLPGPDGQPKNINTTRNLLAKLRREDKVVLQNNRYSVVSVVTRSQDSQRSNHSNQLESDGIGREVTTPDYGVTTAVTTAGESVVTTESEPVEPSRTDKNEQVTTLTTLTMDVPKNTDNCEKWKRIIWRYGKEHEFPRLAFSDTGGAIPETEAAWRGFLKWQNHLWQPAYEAIQSGRAQILRSQGV